MLLLLMLLVLVLLLMVLLLLLFCLCGYHCGSSIRMIWSVILIVASSSMEEE